MATHDPTANLVAGSDSDTDTADQKRLRILYVTRRNDRANALNLTVDDLQPCEDIGRTTNLNCLEMNLRDQPNFLLLCLAWLIRAVAMPPPSTMVVLSNAYQMYVDFRAAFTGKYTNFGTVHGYHLIMWKTSILRLFLRKGDPFLPFMLRECLDRYVAWWRKTITLRIEWVIHRRERWFVRGQTSGETGAELKVSGHALRVEFRRDGGMAEGIRISCRHFMERRLSEYVSRWEGIFGNAMAPSVAECTHANAGTTPCGGFVPVPTNVPASTIEGADGSKDLKI